MGISPYYLPSTEARAYYLYKLAFLGRPALAPSIEGMQPSEEEQEKKKLTPYEEMVKRRRERFELLSQLRHRSLPGVGKEIFAPGRSLGQRLDALGAVTARMSGLGGGLAAMIGFGPLALMGLRGGGTVYHGTPITSFLPTPGHINVALREIEGQLGDLDEPTKRKVLGLVELGMKKGVTRGALGHEVVDAALREAVAQGSLKLPEEIRKQIVETAKGYSGILGSGLSRSFAGTRFRFNTWALMNEAVRQLEAQLGRKLPEEEVLHFHTIAKRAANQGLPVAEAIINYAQELGQKYNVSPEALKKLPAQLNEYGRRIYFGYAPHTIMGWGGTEGEIGMALMNLFSKGVQTEAGQKLFSGGSLREAARAMAEEADKRGKGQVIFDTLKQVLVPATKQWFNFATGGMIPMFKEEVLDRLRYYREAGEATQHAAANPQEAMQKLRELLGTRAEELLKRISKGDTKAQAELVSALYPTGKMGVLSSLSSFEEAIQRAFGEYVKRRTDLPQEQLGNISKLVEDFAKEHLPFVSMLPPEAQSHVRSIIEGAVGGTGKLSLSATLSSFLSNLPLGDLISSIGDQKKVEELLKTLPLDERGKELAQTFMGPNLAKILALGGLVGENVSSEFQKIKKPEDLRNMLVRLVSDLGSGSGIGGALSSMKGRLSEKELEEIAEKTIETGQIHVPENVARMVEGLGFGGILGLFGKKALQAAGHDVSNLTAEQALQEVIKQQLLRSGLGMKAGLEVNLREGLGSLGAFKDFPIIGTMIGFSKPLQQLIGQVLPNYSPSRDISLGVDIPAENISRIFLQGPGGKISDVINITGAKKAPLFAPTLGSLKTFAKYGPLTFLGLNMAVKALSGKSILDRIRDLIFRDKEEQEKTGGLTKKAFLTPAGKTGLILGGVGLGLGTLGVLPSVIKEYRASREAAKHGFTTPAEKEHFVQAANFGPANVAAAVGTGLAGTGFPLLRLTQTIANENPEVSKIRVQLEEMAADVRRKTGLDPATARSMITNILSGKRVFSPPVSVEGMTEIGGPRGSIDPLIGIPEITPYTGTITTSEHLPPQITRRMSEAIEALQREGKITDAGLLKRKLVQLYNEVFPVEEITTEGGITEYTRNVHPRNVGKFFEKLPGILEEVGLKQEPIPRPEEISITEVYKNPEKYPLLAKLLPQEHAETFAEYETQAQPLLEKYYKEEYLKPMQHFVGTGAGALTASLINNLQQQYQQAQTGFRYLGKDTSLLTTGIPSKKLDEWLEKHPGTAAAITSAAKLGLLLGVPTYVVGKHYRVAGTYLKNLISKIISAGSSGAFGMGEIIGSGSGKYVGPLLPLRQTLRRPEFWKGLAGGMLPTLGIGLGFAYLTPKLVSFFEKRRKKRMEAEEEEARMLEQKLKNMEQEKAASWTPLELAADLGGLGLLSVPAVYNLLHKEKPEDRKSKFHRFMQDKAPHIFDVLGLTTLAVPAIKALVTKDIGPS